MTELKRMNDDVAEDSSLKDVDSFKKQYAAVLVQLNEVLDQAYLFFLFYNGTTFCFLLVVWCGTMAMSGWDLDLGYGYHLLRL